MCTVTFPQPRAVETARLGHSQTGWATVRYAIRTFERRRDSFRRRFRPGAFHSSRL
jgi:hypothetical protein